MMEEAYAGECHGDAVAVAGGDDVVVAYASARLCHVGHATAVGTLDVVADGEECIAAKAHAMQFTQPLVAFLWCERSRPMGEELLPGSVAQHVVGISTKEEVDGVVAVGTAYAGNKG